MPKKTFKSLKQPEHFVAQGGGESNSPMQDLLGGAPVLELGEPLAQPQDAPAPKNPFDLEGLDPELLRRWQIAAEHNEDSLPELIEKWVKKYLKKKGKEKWY
ncbi:MAG: hypothetical protein RRB13_16085 [bacterium]|nr:hypothetical protein [bacterium]